MEVVNELVQVFMEEADGRLNDLKSAVNGEISEQNCEKARISSHTIKGMSSQMGYENIALLSKEMEKFFIAIRDLKKMPTIDNMEAIKQGVSLLEALFEKLKKDGDDNIDVSKTVECVKNITNSFKGE